MVCCLLLSNTDMYWQYIHHLPRIYENDLQTYILKTKFGMPVAKWIRVQWICLEFDPVCPVNDTLRP